MAFITICTPHGRDIEPEYIVCLAQTLRAATHEYEVLMYEGLYPHILRNMHCRDARGDYLLWIDADTFWKPTYIDRLLAMDRDAVSGLYYHRRSPFKPVVYRFDGNEFVSVESVPDRAFRCDSAGAGFLLVKKPVVQKMMEPAVVQEMGFPWDPIKTAQAGKNLTFLMGEDHSFFMRLNHLGFEAWCDPEVICGHVGTRMVGCTPG